MRLRRLDRGVAGQLPDRKTSLLELEVAALRVVRAHLQQLRDLRAVHVRHVLAVDADERPADLDAAEEGRRLADHFEDRGLGREDQPQRTLGRVDGHTLHDCSPGALSAAPGPRRGARGLRYGGSFLPGRLCERGTASALRGSPWAKRFTREVAPRLLGMPSVLRPLARDACARDRLPGVDGASGKARANRNRLKLQISCSQSFLAQSLARRIDHCRRRQHICNRWSVQLSRRAALTVAAAHC